MDIQHLIETDHQLLLFFNSSGSMFADSLAMLLTSGFTWIPLYIAWLYLILRNNEKFSQIALILAACGLCLLLSAGVSEIIVKPYVGRLRPPFNPLLEQSLHLVNGYRAENFSFFSSHASNTFSLAVFFSLLVRHRVFSMFLLGWSLLNCWTRLYLGVHYPSDILVGLVWGLVCGLVAYWFYFKCYNKISPRLNYVSTQYTHTGYSLPDIDVVINILLLTVVCAVVRAVILLN